MSFSSVSVKLPTSRDLTQKRRKLRAYCRVNPDIFITSSTDFFGNVEASKWSQNFVSEFSSQAVRWLNEIMMRNDFFVPGDTPDLKHLLNEQPIGTYFITSDLNEPNIIFLYYTTYKPKTIYTYKNNKEYLINIKEKIQCQYVLTLRNDFTVFSGKTRRREIEAYNWRGDKYTSTKVEWTNERTKNIHTAIEYLYSIGLIKRFLFQK